MYILVLSVFFYFFSWSFLQVLRRSFVLSHINKNNKTCAKIIILASVKSIKAENARKFQCIFVCQMMTKQHRTHAATTKTVNDLWCYQCNTLDDGDSCTNLTDPNGNYTNFRYKCEDENRICMVKQHTYNYTTNSTKTPVSKLWYIERNCTSKCEPDCIVIGERSKIISCTICCDANFCNNGTSTAHEMPLKWKKEQRILLILAIIFNILFLT